MCLRNHFFIHLWDQTFSFLKKSVKIVVALMYNVTVNKG
jgi:hypothetical protein